MNFSEERWVKLYTRDTTGWRMLTWQARCVLLHAFRKVDRSGAIDLDGDGLDGLAVMLDLPPEVVEAAMSGKQGLVARGAAEVVTLEGRSFFLLPRFIEAQDAKSTPRARKAASRELALAAQSDVTRLDVLGHSVTKRDQESQNVTESHAASHEVTRGHTASRSDQNRSEQNRTETPERGRAGVLNLESGSQVGPEFAAPDSAAVAGSLAASPTPPATLAAPEPSEPVLGHPDAESGPRGDRGVQPSEWRQWWSGWILDYQASVRRARSLPNWTSPSNENRSLEQALAGFCRGPNANPAKVPGWIADSVTRFVEATRDKSAFFGEHGPRGFLKWLNSGGLDVPVQAPIQYKPSPPPPPAWVSPLHPDRLGVAKRANLLSMLTSTGTGSEEWERVKMPVLSGDEQSAPDPAELDAALCDLTELESIHEGPAIAVKRRIQKYLDRKAGKAGAA